MIEVQMAKTAKMIMKNVLCIQPGENVCILTDTERPESITRVLAIAAQMAGAETVVVTMTPREMGGVEPPTIVASAMIAADAIINQTSHSLTHTNAQRNALKRRARVCNLREVNEDMMIRGGITADYVKVKELTEKLANLLTISKKVHITTPQGTNMTMNIEGRRGNVLAGFATNPGEFSGLPDGEACVAPLEDMAEGIIVNPYSIEKINIVKEPFRLEVKNGKALKIEGGKEAKQLESIIEKAGETGRNIAEFAIGTNPECRITGITREDKKSWGSAHIALGDNKTLGGIVESYMHLDIIMLKPTVRLDDVLVVDNGKIVY